MQSITASSTTEELLARLDRLFLVGEAVMMAKATSSRVFDELVDIDGLLNDRGVERPFCRLQDRAIRKITQLWESGWQPHDVVHVVRRVASPRAAHLLILTVRTELAQSPFETFVPVWWQEQIESLVATLPPQTVARLESSLDLRAQPFTSWMSAAQLSMGELLEDALALVGNLNALRPISKINEPPSRWEQYASRQISAPTSENRTENRSDAATSSKTLATIRSLLAKAEATTFPAEADTFAEKAQELMTRHSIDVAMLDERHGANLAAGVVARRFQIEQPYAKEKVALLSAVGLANQVRVVFDSLYGLANAIGFADDIEVTDMLYTSLLVQAAHSMAASAKQREKSPSRPSHQSSATYRRAFWLSYAARVGERLEEAKDRVTAEQHASYGAALVPVLRARSDAVDAKVDELFTNVRTMKTRTVDAEGWWAGRSAADQASLGVAKGRIKR